MTVEGEDEDIFIPESQVNGAFHGDTVQVALTRAEGHGRRREGQITKILTRGVSRIVCTYEKARHSGSQCRIIRDSDRIFLSRRSALKVR